jgi:outer membrane murein-binding lipoprotein Lpp
MVSGGRSLRLRRKNHERLRRYTTILIMKDWEIDKINKLYAQVDELVSENKRLKHSVEATKFDNKLIEMKTTLDSVVKKLDALAKKIK